MKRILAGLLVIAALLMGAPAVAAPSDVTVQYSSPECWGRHRASTLRHLVVFNNGSTNMRYSLRWKMVGSKRVHVVRDRVPHGEGVLEGILVRPHRKVAWVRLWVGSRLAFERSTPWTAARRCARRAH